MEELTRKELENMTVAQALELNKAARLTCEVDG